MESVSVAKQQKRWTIEIISMLTTGILKSRLRSQNRLQIGPWKC